MTTKSLLKRLLSVRATLFLTAAGVVIANCAQSDTVLLVHVTASMPIDEVQQLHATIRVGGQTHTIDVPDAPVAIAFPTSFTVQLARSFTGDLSVNIDARNGAGAVVASGDQTVSPLRVGSQNEISVDLAPGPLPDGGADGPPNTQGTGGATGTGGVTTPTGSGGASAGSGGATAGSSGSSGGTGVAGSGGVTASGGAGGASATGGRSAGGGTGSGGSAATGGKPGTGGAAATGGLTGSAGVQGTGGTPAVGGAAGGGAPGGAAGSSSDGDSAFSYR